MSFRRAAILGVIFFILLLLYYFVEDPTGRGKKNEAPLVFPGFDPDRAAAVSVQSPERGLISLTQEQGFWKVRAGERVLSADAAVVGQMLETVSGLKADSVVSRNPKNFDAFEVTAEKGTEVAIQDEGGNSLAHFVVGTNGPDIFSTYLRLKGSSQVILSGQILKTVFDRELAEWRDKTIFSLPKDRIAGYRIEGDMQLRMEKDTTHSWKVVAPEIFPARTGTAQDAVGAFASLKAAGFSEDNASACGLDPPERTITAVLEGEETYALYVGRQKNAFQRFAGKKGDSTVFVLENYELEALCPQLEQLKPVTDDAAEVTPGQDNESRKE